MSEFLDTISEEFRSDPSLADIKDVNALAKGYIHAQKLVGIDKIPSPRDDWSDNDWDQHHSRLGRPDDSTGYSTFDHSTVDDTPEGFELDSDALDSFKSLLHKNGISKRQGDAIIKDMTLSNIDKFRESTSKAISDKESAIASLREEYGDNYDANISIANEIINKFGGDDFSAFLNESGLNNNKDMIKAFVEIGKHFINDTSKAPGESGLNFGSAANAQSEIKRLSGDTEFLKALNDKSHIGHRTALERWRNLHNAAYPKAS